MYEVTPLQGFNKIKFGMPKEKADGIIKNSKTLKGSLDNKASFNDDFVIFYDENDKVCSVEFHTDKVLVNGSQVPDNPALIGRWIRSLDQTCLVQNVNGNIEAVSKKLSIELRTADNKLDFIKFGKKDYYNESVDDIRLRVYEACLSGKITESQRDTLLSKIGHQYISEQATYGNKTDDVKEVLKSLNKTDSDHVGGGYWVDSGHVIYRDVEYKSGKPIGFIDVYSLPKYKNTGLIILAVTKDSRRTGIGTTMVHKMISYCSSNYKKLNISQLRWLVDIDNPASAAMAEKLGFKLNKETKTEKEYLMQLGNLNEFKEINDMDNISELKLSIFEAALRNDIDQGSANQMVGIINESVFSNSPLKKKLDKLSEIKKAKPKDYDGPEEVKKFVDKYYDDIVACAELVEKEPDKLRKNEVHAGIATAAGLFTSYLTALAGIKSFILFGAGFGGMILSIIFACITSIIAYCRQSNDIKASDELAKVREALKKADTSKLPKEYKNKIADIVTSIDDAETEISTRVKVAKESTDMRLKIYEACLAGEITESQRDDLLSKCTDAYKVN